MKSIAGKLVKIMEECGVIRKNGTNDFHHYKYATSADVLEKVNASLVKHKVASVVLPEIIENSDVITGKGNTEHLVTVKVAITLIDTDNGESILLAGIGSGQDGGDKAVMKAQTAAIKYAYMLSFAISTNDDPEADSRTDESTRPQEHHQPVLPLDNAQNCRDCGIKITAGVMSVSVKKFGRPLCMKCQKKTQGAA
ncbi:ERF family protein [Sporomusa sp.]|uniref:ERF family protein n=1 Tax=Sporomusa sp. TaxID=2078658 RepID=UPI002B93D487|nr:ERF family protein [Sporomusa sp.]HWR08532.1 ERF family protein [Sporomusa sp.]